MVKTEKVKTEKVKTETRDLAMHPKLLMDTIRRQAGTLQKANLEGVMNAIEAGSPVVRIELKVDVNDITKARLSIGDDGIGIETKEALIQHFETFGTPHDESENTYWKQFRMGRGQMFAFGKNVWRTATFKMEVDINNNGLTYELTENLPYVKGCQIDIDLYMNPVGYSHSSINNYKECIQKQVRFMEGIILFNGEQINTPASTCKWDFEDDNAYYLFNVGTDFRVYNLGAYVMDASLSDIGMMGIVVSKKQLKVNFARNDVQHDCEVYNGYYKADQDDQADQRKHKKKNKVAGILDIVKRHRIKKTRKARRTLRPWERTATLKELRDGEQELKEVKTLALIPTAQGKYITLNDIRKMKQEWCFAPLGDRYADRLMERGQAVCISDEIISELSYTGEKSRFFMWLTNNEQEGYRFRENEWENVSMLYVDFEKLSDGINDSYEILPTDKYTPSERRIIQVLQQQDCWNNRQILLGYSDTASAWTNGVSYIVIDRNWLKRQYVTGSRDIATIQMLLSHEMAHDDDSRGTHIHGPEFYENMISIMEGDDSPIAYCASFKYAMERSKIDERQLKEERKQKKAQEKVNSRLGIAAKSA